MPHHRSLTITLTLDAFIALHELADLSGVKPTAFVRTLVEYAATHRLTVREKFEDKIAWLDAIADGKSPPKVCLEIALDSDSPHAIREASSPSIAWLARTLPRRNL